MKPLCVLLTALLLTASAQARLGETEDQMVARLGKPYGGVGSPPAAYYKVYRVPGYIVTVQFESGVSVTELYKPNASDGQSQVSGKMNSADMLAKAGRWGQ